MRATAPWFFALVALLLSSCMSAPAAEPADCAEALAQLTERRLEHRESRLGPAEARQHAKQIAAAAQRAPIAACQSLNPAAQHRFVQCVADATTIAAGNDCLRALPKGHQFVSTTATPQRETR